MATCMEQIQMSTSQHIPLNTIPSKHSLQLSHYTTHLNTKSWLSNHQAQLFQYLCHQYSDQVKEYQYYKESIQMKRINRWYIVKEHVYHLFQRGLYTFKQEKQDYIKNSFIISPLHHDFWLEALDMKHRYGLYLRMFHAIWKDEMKHCTTTSYDERNNSFFYWLDYGAGKYIQVPECNRNTLETTRVEYCNKETRQQYQVMIQNIDKQPVLIYKKTKQLVQTNTKNKWIFVVDQQERIYIGRKRKGAFHHSSFVAGEPILAAGKIIVRQGQILMIEPHSGHYKPKLTNLTALCTILQQMGVQLNTITFIQPKKWEGEWPFPCSDASEFSDSDDNGEEISEPEDNNS